MIGCGSSADAPAAEAPKEEAPAADADDKKEEAPTSLGSCVRSLQRRRSLRRLRI